MITYLTATFPNGAVSTYLTDPGYDDSVLAITPIPNGYEVVKSTGTIHLTGCAFMAVIS